MNPTDFQAFVVSNWSRGKKPSKIRSLAIMSLGVAGEAGEVSDMLKKHIRTGKPMDVDALKLELGDLLHYVARVAAEFNFPALRVFDWGNRQPRKLKTLGAFASASLGISAGAGRACDELDNLISKSPFASKANLIHNLCRIADNAMKVGAHFGLKQSEVFAANHRKLIARNAQNPAWRTEKNT